MIRATFDQWFAERAAEKGAMVLPKMKVDSLLREGGDTRAGAELSAFVRATTRLRRIS